MITKQDVYSNAREARDRAKAAKDDYDEAVEAYEAANRDSIEAQAAYEDAESVYESAIADYAAAREARARVQAEEDVCADSAEDAHAEDLGFSKSARKCESGNLITLCDWKDTQEPSYNALTTSLMDKGRKKILGRHYKIKCATCGQQRFSMEVVR